MSGRGVSGSGREKAFWFVNVITLGLGKRESRKFVLGTLCGSSGKELRSTSKGCATGIGSMTGGAKERMLSDIAAEGSGETDPSLMKVASKTGRRVVPQSGGALSST